jgi:hypothetical protein
MGKGSVLEGRYAELTNKLVFFRTEYVSLMEQYSYEPDLVIDKLQGLSTQLELTKAEVLAVWDMLKEERASRNPRRIKITNAVS